MVKSEQDKLAKRKKQKKFKNLWKDHVKVLKQIDNEDKGQMDAIKRKTLMLAEKLEYEDEYGADFEEANNITSSALTQKDFREASPSDEESDEETVTASGVSQGEYKFLTTKINHYFRSTSFSKIKN